MRTHRCSGVAPDRSPAVCQRRKAVKRPTAVRRKNIAVRAGLVRRCQPFRRAGSIQPWVVEVALRRVGRRGEIIKPSVSLLSTWPGRGRCLPWFKVQTTPDRARRCCREPDLAAQGKSIEVAEVAGLRGARNGGRNGFPVSGHHAARQRGAMLRTNIAPPRDISGHHAACQRGAMFRTSHRPVPRTLRPPRCLPAWGHVQVHTSSRSARPAS